MAGIGESSIITGYRRETNTPMDDALSAAQGIAADAAVADRAFSGANLHIFTIALQCRRLRSTEPEDQEFPRWWSDLQFLLIELVRLRSEAAVFGKAAHIDIGSAIHDYDEALSDLREMRNVGEHITDYYDADSKARRHKAVDPRQLQVGSWDGTTYSWLGHEFNIDRARAAAEALFNAMRAAKENSRDGSG